MMFRPVILVIGSRGQLGQCLQKIAPEHSLDYDFVFTDSDTVDITDPEQIDAAFSDHQPAFCVNASAYTAVDKAEEPEEGQKAFAINADGVKNLAEACTRYGATFIHVSTDYVFSGNTEISYDESHFTAPQSVYGESKLAGENLALEYCKQTIIIRTSWLYSEFGKNFVKTMLHLFATKKELGIVADQFGQPTNANDLAEAIMKIITGPIKKCGIYHYSNAPETTWYLFAEKIAALSGSDVVLNALTTDQYPTAATRPRRSTMALDKIQADYHVDIRHWEDSLADCIHLLQAQ